MEPISCIWEEQKNFTTTSKYVPMLEGRSSTGRLGLCIHVTAGFETLALQVTDIGNLLYPSTDYFILILKYAKSIIIP